MKSRSREVPPPESTASGAREHAIVMLDPQGVVVGWNAGAERIKGYRAAEVLGRSFHVFYPPEDVAAGEPQAHLAEAARAGHVQYEGWRLRKDGSRFWADVILTAVFDAAGGVRGLGKVTRDATARRRAERTLRDSEQHYQQLAAGLRDCGIVMLDPLGRITSWSAGADQLTGYALSDLLGRPLGLLATDEDRQEGAPEHWLAEAIAAGHVELETWLVRKGGDRLRAAVAVTALLDHTGALRGLGAVIRRLRDGAGPVHPDAQGEDLRQLLDGVRSHAIVMLDAEGTVIGWNGGAERITGYTAAEACDRSLESFYPAEEVEVGAPQRHLEAAVAAGYLEYEGWRVRKDGSHYWADVVLTAVRGDDGRLIGFGKVTRDATVRRKAELALQDSREQVQLLAATVRDHAIVMLDASGTIIGWNAGAEQIKGYRAAEVLGRSVEVFYPPHDVEAAVPAAHLDEATRSGHVEYEGWRVRKDGSSFFADVVLTAVFDDDGSVRGFGEVTRDATARRDAEQALRDSEEHYRLLVASVRDYAIVQLDPGGTIVSWNAGAEHISGYGAEEVIGRPITAFASPEDRSTGLAARRFAEAVRTGHSEHEGWQLRKDGSRYWATVVLTALFDDAGEVRGVRTVTRDITERRRFEAQLSHQALHDPLTGLGNRILLVEHLEHALTRLPRHPSVLAVLFLDLDRFKLVNDTLGHDAGDEMLVQTAALLREALRPQDLVARFGGDEFVVMCEDITDGSALDAIARRVTEALHVPVRLHGREVLLSASVGVATARDGITAGQLIRDADTAMYQAKEAGRGRYAVYDERSREGLSDRLRLATELHRTLDNDELRAHHQPLVDLRTGELVATEALVRWQHPTQGLLAPAAFLSTAEELGTVVSFDAWMMSAACADAVQHGVRLGRPVGVWVNLAGRTLAAPNLVSAVREALHGAGLEPGLLTLEITEGALMRDAAATVRTLTTLRGLGVRLAVDDFGTGYSSLSYLQQFPVDALKVDRSFVARLDAPQDTAASAAIVRAVVSLAAGLGMRTVVEGIETPAQLEAVRALGCDVGQGFLLGRPGPSEMVVAPTRGPGDGASEPSGFPAGASEPTKGERGPARRRS